MILNIHASNGRDSKYVNQKLMEPQEGIVSKRTKKQTKKYQQNDTHRDFPGSSVVKTSPSNAGLAVLFHGRKVKRN